MNISESILKMAEKIEKKIQEKIRETDKLIDHNQWKTIRAFQRAKVSEYHFASSTGYGYNDTGREVLEQVFAEVFGGEAALVRPHFASGTHTITTALFGLLRPGDRLLYITGKPYDTLRKVIGTENDGTGSLADFGISYGDVELLPGGEPDWEGIRANLTENTKVVAIQRSRGYEWRPSISIDRIAEMCRFVRSIRPDAIIFVDNCYGEFTETLEPCHVGADLVAGSLIKNPGGGLAMSGGYIVGRKKYVDLAANRLTAPGIGKEVGAMLGTNRLLFQGLFLAPHMVGQALKGSIFAAALLEELGFETHPRWDDDRSDLIQAVRLPGAEHLVAFVQGVQMASAVDAHVIPEPSPMPGYSHPVIMAAGTFIQGGSLELSADAPVREPFIAYLQGGLTYSHAKLGVMSGISRMMEKGLL